jgi:hypothetical protein
LTGFANAASAAGVSPLGDPAALEGARRDEIGGIRAF